MFVQFFYIHSILGYIIYAGVENTQKNVDCQVNFNYKSTWVTSGQVDQRLS